MTELKVLVYGTLRKGEGNFRLMPAKNGNFKTVDLIGFRMHHLGGFPGVIRGTEKDKTIAELWTLKFDSKEEHDYCLQRLDHLEGHPNFYRREIVKTADGDEGWMYIFQGNVKGCPVLTDWVKEKNIISRYH